MMVANLSDMEWAPPSTDGRDGYIARFNELERRLRPG
jgi:hypothetical protein